MWSSSYIEETLYETVPASKKNHRKEKNKMTAIKTEDTVEENFEDGVPVQDPNETNESISEDVVDETKILVVSKEEFDAQRDDFQRLNAEYVNYRNRVERDKDVSAQNATRKFISDLLPTLDDMENARKHEAVLAEDPNHPVNRIFDKLISTLTAKGMVIVNSADVPFDANIHEAVIAQPVEGKEEGSVVQVFRTGYLYNDFVVRAAQVMVAQ